MLSPSTPRLCRLVHQQVTYRAVQSTDALNYSDILGTFNVQHALCLLVLPGASKFMAHGGQFANC